MKKIDRRLIANLDWLTLTLVLLLTLTGMMTIFSATRPVIEGEHSAFHVKQAYWLIVALFAMAFTVSIDYVWLKRLAYVFYAAGIVLLVFVLIKGRVGMGAQRWISLGPVGFQPSEFFKLAFAAALARHMSDIRGGLSTKNLLATFFALVLAPLLLIVKQPDLGTAVVVLMLFASMALAKGVEKKVAVFAVVIALISVPFIGNIFWNELKDYQKKRLVVFIDPEVDPAGISYHINQSKVAIGSGGAVGKGYLNGTQGPFRFLPEKHTDFIFSVFAEEWGLMGSTLLLFIYLALILRGLETARKAKDDFGSYLALGVTMIFLIYGFINMAMTMGMMPVVGIPLPFMSYGGTALVSNYVAAGVLMNIRSRRYELFY